MTDPTGVGLDGRWDELVNRARSMVIETVRARTGIDLKALIIDEEVNSPPICKFYSELRTAHPFNLLQGRKSSIWTAAPSWAFRIAFCKYFVSVMALACRRIQTGLRLMHFCACSITVMCYRSGLQQPIRPSPTATSAELALILVCHSHPSLLYLPLADSVLILVMPMY